MKTLLEKWNFLILDCKISGIQIYFKASKQVSPRPEKLKQICLCFTAAYIFRV